MTTGDVLRCESLFRDCARELSTQERIYDAAVGRFAARGFAATTLRQIASDVGLEVGSLYNHIASKQDLLYRLMCRAMAEITEYVAAAESLSDDPSTRLWNIAKAHVEFYAIRRQQARALDMEIRSLAHEHYIANRQLRKGYEKLFIDALEDGIQKGRFRDVDTHTTAFALISLCSGVATWYTYRGSRQLDELARSYADLVIRSVSISGPEGSEERHA